MSDEVFLLLFTGEQGMWFLRWHNSFALLLLACTRWLALRGNESENDKVSQSNPLALMFPHPMNVSGFLYHVPLLDLVTSAESMAALCREFGKLTLRAYCREFGWLTLASNSLALRKD